MEAFVVEPADLAAAGEVIEPAPGSAVVAQRSRVAVQLEVLNSPMIDSAIALSPWSATAMTPSAPEDFSC